MEPEKALVFVEGTVAAWQYTSVRLLQLKKALSPMLVTPSGMVMAVRLLQLKKALSPMLVTPSGMVMAVRSAQA